MCTCARTRARVCLYSISHYRIITFQLSLTQESRGLGAHTKKERFLREQEIGLGSSERVIIVKCQVNSEGLSSSNWEQISPDGDIFNTVLSDQSATDGINQIPSLICLLTERSVSAHCFPFKMCLSFLLFFFPFFFFSLFIFFLLYLWWFYAGNQGPFISKLNIQHLNPTFFL